MYPCFPAEKTEAKRGKVNDLFQVPSSYKGCIFE